jgi:hypothetical protein
LAASTALKAAVRGSFSSVALRLVLRVNAALLAGRADVLAPDEIRSRRPTDRLTLAPASDCESAGVVVRHDCQTSSRA